ncbi:ABC-2 type transport system ATP-binding protein [Enhydrobacter aerosaccus]|uniref:ABC-2 type transport system ATP-binding protein n=1 Tax=Enhydrobacter aerosaccus TaxID=225324 RepID=A0A1T4T0J2_9HYPH|nr:ATP-binding cassette domain-containing protein [Enhydrobacter aerosaccus]SKA33922.1 ABC-2 type transport system ATP-binding protein [Enhydrobacter aerosaccus]
MAPAAPPIVVVDAVTKRFGKGPQATIALDHVSAEIRPGQITGLVGPDGAGKTTLLRLIAGLLKPNEGKITVLGQDSVTAVTTVQHDIGYMPQRFGLYEDLTVAENLDLYADMHELDGTVRQERFASLLAFTALTPFVERLAGKLSGGMKQKLGLACALLSRPKLLLLDEPSAGVDPASRRELWRIVRTMAGEGVAVIWSTAYLDEAERCDSFLLFANGRLLASGSPTDFSRRVDGRTFLITVPPGHKHRVQRRAAADPAIADAIIQGERIRIVLNDGATLPDAAVLGGTGLPQPVRPRFEDAFVSLLHGRTAPRSSPAVPEESTSTAVTDGAAIEAHDLTRDFGAFRAVDNVTFTVAPGEVFGLLGPNGAGKSTTFRMLCGLLEPSAGSARVAGVDLGTARAAARERIGYMSQRFSLYGELSVRDNLDFFSGVYGLSSTRRRQRIDWALESFELGPVARQTSGSLPLGFKQRLALSCALLHEPRVLFLDEPTSGVDPLMRREFWARIGALAEQRVTVLVTSHFMDEAEYCDRLAIVYGGRMIAMGSPDDLKRRFVSDTLPDPTLEDAFVALIETQGTKAAP